MSALKSTKPGPISRDIPQKIPKGVITLFSVKRLLTKGIEAFEGSVIVNAVGVPYTLPKRHSDKHLSMLRFGREAFVSRARAVQVSKVLIDAEMKRMKEKIEELRALKKTLK